MKIHRLLRVSFATLHPVQKQKYFFALILQVVTAILDIAAVLLIGGIGLLTASTVSGSKLNPQLREILTKLGVVNSETSKQILVLSLLAAFLFVIRSSFSLILSRRVLNFLSAHQISTGNKVFANAISAPFSFMRNRNPQTFSTNLMFGLSAFTINGLGQLFMLLSETIVVAVMFLTILAVDFKLALCLVCYFLFLIVLMNSILGKVVSRANKEQYEYRIQAEQVIQDSVRIFRDIKISNRGKHFEQAFSKSLRLQSRAYAQDVWAQSLPKYIFEFALLSGILSLALVGSFSGNFYSVIPTLTIFIAATSRILPSLLRIQGSLFNLRSHSFFANRYFELSSEIDRSLVQNQNECNSVRNEVPYGNDALVSLESVNFTFSDTKAPFLSDLNIRIFKGERIALVGSSGSGKSTLSDLIMGLLKPDSGVFGSSLNTDGVTSEIAYLPQETVLIPGTILDNICLGMSHSDIDLDFVQDLILKCKLNTLIQDNPDGLHTPIGVGGILLSGGEKQRIGIARALYSNPKLIVLDEPTSALDPKTELEILNLILEIDPRTTVILITHKLHQLVNFPRIIFLEHGRILCDGNFTTVKAKITSFANLLDIAGL